MSTTTDPRVRPSGDGDPRPLRRLPSQQLEAAWAVEELRRNLHDEVMAVWALEVELRWLHQLLCTGAIGPLLRSQRRVGEMLDARGERNLVRHILTVVILDDDRPATLLDLAGRTGGAAAADLIALREELSDLIRRLAVTVASCRRALAPRRDTGVGPLGRAVLGPTAALLEQAIPRRLVEFLARTDSAPARPAR